MKKIFAVLVTILVCFPSCEKAPLQEPDATETQKTNVMEMQELDTTGFIQAQDTDVQQARHIIGVPVYEKAVIITDNLNIRNSPSFESAVVDKYYFGTVVSIYAIMDYGDVVNGEYNCWYKLSDTQEIWANSLYIKRFPFIVGSVESKWDYAYIPYTIEINDVIKTDMLNTAEENGGYRFKLLFLPYIHEALHVKIEKTILIDGFRINESKGGLHFEIIYNKYDNLHKLVNENMLQLKKRLQPIIMQEKYLVEGVLGVPDSVYSMPGYKVYYTAMEAGLINKMDVSTENERFLYGLRVGEKSSYLEKVLGSPIEIRYSERDNQVFYYITSLDNAYAPEILTFEIENGKIINIGWYIDL